MSISTSNLFAQFPETLRTELIDSFSKIEKNFRENRWEPSELNGGKLCEIVYSILKGYLDGNFHSNSSKPRNMVDACKSLEQYPSSHPRSVRIQIPRMITALYEIRNNRGVGHVGGDVDPNKMDATCVLQMSKWILTELIRVFHNISTEEAATYVDSISEREITLIWTVKGVSRILHDSLTMLQKTLLLLYHTPSGLLDSELINSIEPSNPSAFRRNILVKNHKSRLIEYNLQSRLAIISPKGVEKVEKEIL